MLLLSFFNHAQVFLKLLRLIAFNFFFNIAPLVCWTHQDKCSSPLNLLFLAEKVLTFHILFDYPILHFWVYLSDWPDLSARDTKNSMDWLLDLDNRVILRLIHWIFLIKTYPAYTMMTTREYIRQYFFLGKCFSALEALRVIVEVILKSLLICWVACD
jgi:hypothetical protein